MNFVAVLIVLSLPICFGQGNEYTLNCKPKPGCHVAKCDPIPKLAKSDLNSEEYLQRNEYPITCDGKLVDAEDENLTEEIKNLEGQIIEIKQDSLRQTANQSNLRENRISLSERKIRQTALADTALELAKAKRQMETYSRSQAQKVEQDLRKEIKVQIENWNKTQDKNLAELLKSCDDKVSTAIQGLRAELRRDMSNMEKKLDAVIKTSIDLAVRAHRSRSNANPPRATPNTTSRPTTTTNTPIPIPRTRTPATTKRTTSATPPQEKARRCEVRYRESCFWVDSHWRGFTYERGRAKCKLANIYSKGHYDLVVEMIRQNVMSSAEQTAVWIGVTFDPLKNEAHLSDGSEAPFLKWYPGYPDKGRSFSDRKRVYLYVQKDKGSRFQGMINAGPSQRSSFPAIVCEK